jgi:hypothetical protein
MGLRSLDGHQLARPTKTARAGTVTVRTRKVSSSNPTPMMNPTCTMPAMLPKVRPNMDAAKMIPADVITPPVAPTVRITAVRIPRDASSRIREISSRL